MGFITNNERYNQVIDIWTHTNSRITAKALMKQFDYRSSRIQLCLYDAGFGARGSKEQIRQLGGMRGLMAKPQKSGSWCW